MKRQPNILVILSDQHRYDCTGYSNKYPVITPNLDRLAREGVSYTNAYTPIPLCCPARQAFMTGRRPENYGTFWNYDILPTPTIDADDYTWTKELNQNGFRTGYIGKWHVHPKYTPTTFGFDDYISEGDYQKFRKDKYPAVQLTNGYWGEIDSIPLEDTRTHWFANHAIRLIEHYSEEHEPWFIRVDFPEPHLPCQPHEQFIELFRGKEIPKWHSFTESFINKPYIQKQQLLNWGIEGYTWNEWLPVVERYYAIISQMDDAIGKITAKLRDMGIDDNTVIIYSSDHGDMCGGHRMMDKHYILYDDVVRVPLIIKQPRNDRIGQTVDSFVYNMLDLPPTILELAGLNPNREFEGCSLIGLMQGNTTAADNWRTEVISTYHGHQFGLYTQRMVRNHKWKYVWNPTDVDELYDMEKDSAELNNLIYSAAHQTVLSDLRKTLHAELKAMKDPFLKYAWLDGQLLQGIKQ